MLLVEFRSTFLTQLTENPDTMSMNFELLIIIFVTVIAREINLFQCKSTFANKNKQKTHT